MKNLVWILALVPTLAFAALATDKTLFPSARRDVETILKNKVFRAYADYTIVNIRQGAVGEAAAYFVTLKQPFAVQAPSVCFQFQSKEPKHWDLVGKPGDCKE